MKAGTKRLAAVAVLVGGLLGAPAPPAHSTTLFTAFVASQVTVGFPGLGYPGLTLTVETHLLTGSPTQVIAHLFDADSPPANCLTLPDGFGDDPFCLTNSHITFDHLRSVALASVVCLGGSANLAKGGPPVGGPTCAFGSVATPSLPNTISGHCGQNSGQMTIRFVDASALLTPQVYLIDAHFISTMGATTDGHMILTGHVTKTSGVGLPQRGLVVAVLDQQGPTPFATSNESCVNKTARNFVFTGVVVGYTN